uniref:Uncharacterized protein n=1 Tax=Oryza rufipogon TaxID=4529 RepID=A0A0E0QIZ9_ORYRU
MNVTRPLSRYLDNPDAAAERPPEGPGSGFLVVEDEAAVEQAATICCGLCHDPRVRTLPFTQSWRLYMGEDNVVVFVPVVGEPLSAGCYYVDRSTGSHHAGKVLAYALLGNKPDRVCSDQFACVVCVFVVNASVARRAWRRARTLAAASCAEFVLMHGVSRDVRIVRAKAGEGVRAPFVRHPGPI